MTEQFTNFAIGTLSSALDNTTDPVSIVLAAGEGTHFPSSATFRVWIDQEILIGNGRSGDILTGCQRAQEGTTIAAHSVGVPVVHGPTAASHQLHTHLGADMQPNSVDATANLGFSTAGLAQRALYSDVVLASSSVVPGNLLEPDTTTAGRMKLTTTATAKVAGIAMDSGNAGDTIRMALLGVVQVLVNSASATTMGSFVGPSSTTGSSAPVTSLLLGSGVVPAGYYLETTSSGTSRLVWCMLRPAINLPANVGGSVAKVTPDGTPDGGSSTSYIASNHQHGVDTYSSTPARVGVASAGTSGTAPSRGDHVHNSPVVRLLVGSVSYNNDAAEHIVETLTIGAGEVTVAGTTYRFRVSGRHDSAVGADTTGLRIRLNGTGGTQLFATPTTSLNQDGTPWILEGVFTIVTTGSGGTMIGSATYKIGGATGAPTLLTATTAFNTTVSNTIDLTNDFTAASTSRRCWTDNAVWEKLVV